MKTALDLFRQESAGGRRGNIVSYTVEGKDAMIAAARTSRVAAGHGPKPWEELAAEWPRSRLDAFRTIG